MPAGIRFDDVLFPSLLSGILVLLNQGNKEKKLVFDIKLLFFLAHFGKKNPTTPLIKHSRLSIFTNHRIIQVRRDLRWSSRPFPFFAKFSLY